MKIFLFFLASVATVDLASAQMLPPTLGGTYAAPGYVAPSYPGPGYVAPGPTAPGYTTPGYTAPGYAWRGQQADEDWRNNTWREQRANEDWRTNNWRQQRANEDWRQRKEYAKERTPNNAVDRGFAETDKATKNVTEEKKNPLEKDECGRSGPNSLLPCPDYAKSKQKNSTVDAAKNNPINRGYGPK